MSAAHTAGPWRVGPIDDTLVSAADRTEIAAMKGDYDDGDIWPVMEANARLIAAAPDLLAALKRALFVMESPAFDQKMINGGGAVDVVRAALAKAEGKAP